MKLTLNCKPDQKFCWLNRKLKLINLEIWSKVEHANPYQVAEKQHRLILVKEKTAEEQHKLI